MCIRDRLIGGAFSTGQEAMQFFVGFGAKGLVGLIICGLLMIYTCFSLLKAGKQNDLRTNEDAFRYFMDHDKVTLITKNENSIKKGPDDWSETYEIDPEIFPYRCGYSTTYTDEALIYLKRLYEEKTKSPLKSNQ